MSMRIWGSLIEETLEEGEVRWSSRSKLMKGKMPDEPCYPNLASHEGQLFPSMNDSILVSLDGRPDWVLTSRLQRSYRGSICDFPIEGDLLFAYHGEENITKKFSPEETTHDKEDIRAIDVMTPSISDARVNKTFRSLGA